MEYYNRLIDGLEFVRDLGHPFYFFLSSTPIEFKGAYQALMYDYSTNEHLICLHSYANHSYTDLSYLLGKGLELQIGYQKGKQIKMLAAKITGVIKIQEEKATPQIIHFFKCSKHETINRSPIYNY